MRIATFHDGEFSAEITVLPGMIGAARMLSMRVFHTRGEFTNEVGQRESLLSIKKALPMFWRQFLAYSRAGSF